MRRLARVGGPRVALRTLLCHLVLAGALWACHDEGPATPAHIVVTPNLPRVRVGDAQQLTVTVVDADGRAIEGQPVTFRSSDVSVLTVGQSGLLTSIGPLGSSIIHVASGAVRAEVEATVVLGPSTLVVTPDVLDLVTGDRVPLTITVTDENGDVIPTPEIFFETDNPRVAQVSLDGHVTAGEPGGTDIAVRSGGLIRHVLVAVSSP
jgi:hypothetical protein